MNLEEVRKLIQQGQEEQAAEFFRENGYEVTPEDILLSFKNSNYNSRKIFETFRTVLNLVIPDGDSLVKTQEIKSYLKTFIPHQVVDSQDWYSQAVPEYLDSWEDRDQVFHYLWEGLRLIGINDLAIGAAWRAASLLSI
jgi:hypothetical protein